MSCTIYHDSFLSLQSIPSCHVRGVVLAVGVAVRHEGRGPPGRGQDLPHQKEAETLRDPLEGMIFMTLCIYNIYTSKYMWVAH